MGMQENTHKGLAGLFLLLFLLGVVSASLYISNDADFAGAAQVMGICSVFGLLPAIIFIYFGMQLGKQRRELQNLAQFLHAKQRATVTDVSQQYHWNERDAEDKIVAAISEGYIQGHFDRGTRTFYISGVQAQMTFVEKCSSCGAVMGVWVSPVQPAKCEFCGTFHPPPGMAPPPMAHQMAPPPAAAAAAAPYQKPPGGVPPPVPGQSPPGAPPPTIAPPPGQVYQQPMPGVQHPQAPPPAGAYPPQGPPPSGYDHTTQERKRSIKFMFISASPDGMLIIATVLVFLGLMSLAASWSIGGDVYLRSMTMVCGAVFYLPLLVGGAMMILKSVRMDKYLDELNEMADYIVTYRKVEVILLARKMNLPEEQVRRLIDDILKYGLLEGQYSADGSEFAVNLRPEDQQFVPNCPYCKAPGINVQVIRGGSDKCPYCGSVIFFQEKVVS